MKPGFAGSKPFTAARSMTPKRSGIGVGTLGGGPASEASRPATSLSSNVPAVYLSSTNLLATSTTAVPSARISSSVGSKGDRGTSRILGGGQQPSGPVVMPVGAAPL